jgi:hypothetical protein
MSEHEDLELIAAFHEGLLDPADGDRIERHLSGCGECARRQVALNEVVTALAWAAPPPPPPWLAQRLEAALAAEIAAARAATADAPGRAATGAHRKQDEQGVRRALLAGHNRAPGTRGRRRHAGHAPAGRTPDASRPGGRDRPGGRLTTIALRPLAAVASVCLLAGGGYLLANALTHTSPGTSSAIGRSGTQQPAKSGAEVSPRTRMFAPLQGTETAPSKIVQSNTSYQRGQLGAQAAAVASEYATAPRSPGKAGYTTAQPSRINSGLAGCLQRVAGSQRGLIVDMASYDGHPAIVIIAPAAGGAGHVWVVGTECSASAPQEIASSGF